MYRRLDAPHRLAGDVHDTGSARRVVDRWVAQEIRKSYDGGLLGARRTSVLECAQSVLDQVVWERASQRHPSGSWEEWESWLLLDAARTRLREDFGRSTSEARRAWTVKIWERRKEDERTVHELSRTVAEHYPEMGREAVLGYVSSFLDKRARDYPSEYEGAWTLAKRCHREAVLSRERGEPVERGVEVELFEQLDRRASPGLER